MPLAEAGAKFLFQVIAEQPERSAVFQTTNLPFSEWTHRPSHSFLVITGASTYSSNG